VLLYTIIHIQNKINFLLILYHHNYIISFSLNKSQISDTLKQERKMKTKNFKSNIPLST
jgi:hypothetical protein